jgi:hypothetical protein
VSRTSPSDLTYFPEPRLIDFLGSGYTVDRAATEAHYDRLFMGRTAVEVVRFLEGSGVHVFYPSENEISIDIAKRVVVFEYTVGLAFFFEDGIFQRSKVHGPGWK